uniref:Uncharacterized protein n=1 Tax=Anguilla anguilla TaxID=7936 RepID=A0A0E9X1G6_ANGAN
MSKLLAGIYICCLSYTLKLHCEYKLPKPKSLCNTSRWPSVCVLIPDLEFDLFFKLNGYM